MNTLIENIEKLHTTNLGEIRIKRNLSLEHDNVVAWCKAMITKPRAIINKRGKNWYVEVNGYIITINSHSFTIITAHIKS